MRWRNSNKFIALLIVCFLSFLIWKLWTKSTATSEHKFDTEAHNFPSAKLHKPSRRKEIEKEIPEQAYATWKYINQYHKAPDGYVGGRPFKNLERRLPISGSSGKFRYQEWDIYPKEKGKNRGPERLVSQSFRRVWYTPDHYKTFTELIIIDYE